MKQTIIVLDDDPDILDEIAETLVDEGFDVLTVSTGAELWAGQLLICFIPNLHGSVFAEELVDAKVTLQLKMCPVVERIAKGLGDGASPCEVFIIGICIAGAEVFGKTGCAHGPPFVMIALKPDFIKIIKSPVRGYILRREMTMVINYGLVLGVLMVEVTCTF